VSQRMLVVVLTVLVSAWAGHLLFWLFLKMAELKVPEENQNAKWLGFIERALVSLFVCLGLISQTVFIFAVKAAVLGYRLPADKNEHRRMAEYMLLGTMVSYLIGLVCGLAGVQFIKSIK